MKIPIVSDAGAMREIVQDQKNGFVFPSGNWEASANAVSQAIELSEQDRKRMGEAACESIKARFCSHHEIECLANIFCSPETSFESY